VVRLAAYCSGWYSWKDSFDGREEWRDTWGIAASLSIDHKSSKDFDKQNYISIAKIGPILLLPEIFLLKISCNIWPILIYTNVFVIVTVLLHSYWAIIERLKGFRFPPRAVSGAGVLKL
jgi:hypothetical protein